MTARAAPCLHHACQSPSDQGLSVSVRRISTSLPTFSVEKSAWRWARCTTFERCAAPVRARAYAVQMPGSVSFPNKCGLAMLNDGDAERFATRSGSVTARETRRVDWIRIGRCERVSRTERAHSPRTTAKSFRINGLPALADGCPQACQHNLWKRRPSGVRQAGTGKRTVTVSPRPPCVVPSATVARCWSAMRLTIDNPSPLPDDVAACAPSPR